GQVTPLGQRREARKVSAVSLSEKYRIASWSELGKALVLAIHTIYFKRLGVSSMLLPLLGSAPSGLLELVNKKYPVWPLGSSGTSWPNDEKPNTITWRHLTCEVRQDLRLYR